MPTMFREPTPTRCTDCQVGQGDTCHCFTPWVPPAWVVRLLAVLAFAVIVGLDLFRVGEQ